MEANHGIPIQGVQTARKSHPFEGWMGYTPLTAPADGLYTAMREAVPVIDAALDKIVRLTGGFTVECSDSRLQNAVDDFVRSVRVGPCSQGLHQFIEVYLDSLLTYGNAVGEIVLDSDSCNIAALYNAKLGDVQVREGKTPLDVEICGSVDGIEFKPVRYPQLVLFTPLRPMAGEIRGNSLLKSLPFVTSILLKIFASTGTNFERIANLRYAVTYKPESGSMGAAQARDIAQGIANEWADAMSSQKNGLVKDFVAVGDVDIKVIGADNQMISTDIPVRQMLEQIVAKLGIPPFMLGLHWSSTERMSTQQADILTSELWSYRRLLEGVINRVMNMWLMLHSSGATVKVNWDDINLQDEVEAANARLLDVRSELITQEIKEMSKN